MARGRTLLADRAFDGAARSFAGAAASAADERGRYAALLGQVRALGDGGDAETAIAICRQAIAALPDRATGYAMLALLLERLSKFGEATDAASAAIARSPRDGGLHNLAALIALRRHDDRAAAASSRVALTHDPHDQRALADLWLALYRLGHVDEARRLLDLDEAILMSPAIGPDPRLIAAILDHPDLADCLDGPLSSGWRLADLFVLPKSLLEPLRTCLIDATTVHAQTFSPDHPVSTGRPRATAMHGWANVIGPGGAERLHIHEAGWLSAVYYLDMPPAGEGAIALGGHLLDDDGICPVRTFCPFPGSLIVFPSFLYHRTLPFAGPGRRISLAVDILRDPPA